MMPAVDTVVRTITDLVGDMWPRTEGERVAWFRLHRIEPAVEITALRHWGTGVPGWGEAQTFWQLYRGRLAGLGWMLFDGYERDLVMAWGRAAADRLTATLGKPAESAETCEGIRAEWRLRAHRLYVYVHSGRPALGDTPPAPPLVQIHLDLTVLAEARAQAARARHFLR